MVPTYFRDLDRCTYSGPVCSDAGWSCPLRAVGWLDAPHFLFRRGRFPKPLLEKLIQLRTRCSTLHGGFRGQHSCTLCLRNLRRFWMPDKLGDSQFNLFVPGRGEVFIAPGRIDHYIETHHYRPPAVFLDALEACPDPWSFGYYAALRDANDGVEPPLFRDDLYDFLRR